MSIELKIKSKHLSLEAKVIKFEEAKLKKQIRWHSKVQSPNKKLEWKLNSIISNLKNSVTDMDSAPKLLVGNQKNETHLCVVLSSDRGLCGGFNTNICRKAKVFFEKILNERKTLKVIVVGSKANDQLKSTAANLVGSEFQAIWQTNPLPVFREVKKVELPLPSCPCSSKCLIWTTTESDCL